jgi:hypothetical protein
VSLRLFIAVCEERNIAVAARREAIAPSAVSKRIGQTGQKARAAQQTLGLRAIPLSNSWARRQFVILGRDTALSVPAQWLAESLRQRVLSPER